MFTTLKKLTLTATASTLAFAGVAIAAEPRAISEIDVTASYDAAAGTNAQELFPEITSDVQLAIASLVKLSDDAADPIVNVDIRKIALDGDTIIPDSAEFNQIEGIVSIETESGKGGQSFPVNVTAVTGDMDLPEGWIAIAPTTDEFYTAMVAGFADSVAAQVDEINTEGGPVNR